jgi:hypothetical protein
MLYDTRSIAFICELYHPPQATLDATRVQAVHNELFANPRLGYRNFNFIAGGVMLSNPTTAQGAASSLTVLGDRLRVSEELTDSSLDDFIQRLDTVAKLAASKLEIPVFTACQVSVRSLVNPRQFRDAREFLARGMFRFSEEDLSTFGRPSQMLGLRMLFPQVKGERAFYAIRIESYNNDPRSIFVENVGTFPGVVPAAEAGSFVECVRETYRFLAEKSVEFLARFDARPPE